MKNRAQFRPFQCSENCHTPVYSSAWDNNPCQFSLKPLSLTLTSTLSYGKSSQWVLTVHKLKYMLVLALSNNNYYFKISFSLNEYQQLWAFLRQLRPPLFNLNTPGRGTMLHNHHLQRSKLVRCSHLAAGVKPIHTGAEQSPSLKPQDIPAPSRMCSVTRTNLPQPREGHSRVRDSLSQKGYLAGTQARAWE